jgi:hypothetical protein
MHNGLVVLDDRLVATGSYKRSNWAERAICGNLVLLDDPDLVDRFRSEFQRLWQMAKD